MLFTVCTGQEKQRPETSIKSRHLYSPMSKYKIWEPGLHFEGAKRKTEGTVEDQDAIRNLQLPRTKITGIINFAIRTALINH